MKQHPEFTSEAEKRAFWEKNDSSDYLDWNQAEFAAFPLVALLTMIPVSLSGIGVREGGFVYFLGLYGVPAAQAMMLSLAFFAVQVAASLVGGLVYSTGGYKKTETG